MKKRILAWVAAAALVVGGTGTALLAGQSAEASNPHCAGASDKLKSPSRCVRQNFPGCR